MKLRNKKTGKIVEWFNNTGGVLPNSLAELNEGWEDYEEPKKKKYYYYIDSACVGGIDKSQIFNCEHCEKIDDFNKSIGNYFESKEEAKKAVEKLKAWKRLKDNGFKFRGVMENWVSTNGSHLGCFRTDRTIHFNKQGDNDWLEENWNDLLLLFGGEE